MSFEYLKRDALAMFERQKKMFESVGDGYHDIQYYRMCGMIALMREMGFITVQRADEMRDEIADIAFGGK